MLVRARVDFQKPNVKALRRHGMTLVDMHVHTQYSDTYVKVDKVLKKARRLGIGLAITDHNEIRGVLDAIKKRPDVLIIPGIEVTCVERCHLLFYFSRVEDLEEFYHAHVEPYKNKDPFSVTKAHASDLLKAAQGYDCLSSAAHPFGPGFTGIYKCIRRRYLQPSILQQVDALEVMNGTNLKRMNWHSLYWAEHTGKAFTGGSDAHSSFEVGKVLTYSDASSVKGFLNRIRHQRNFVTGKQIGLITNMPSQSRVVRRHFRYLPPILRLRYEVSLKPAVRYHIPRIERGIAKEVQKVKSFSLERVRDVTFRGMRRIDYGFEKVRR